VRADWRGGDDLCRALVETSADAILVADLDGKIALANGRSAEFFGCAAPDELLGLSPADLLPSTDGVPLTAGAAGVPVEMRTSTVSDAAGRPTGSLYVLRDVSELERLKGEHLAIFEATGDGMVVYTLDGTIVAANPAFCEMNGYACEELVGQNVSLLVHPDKHDLLRQFIDTIGGGGSLSARATNVRKDGSTFPVDVHGSVFQDATGSLILGVARDVTEQVQALELLEQRVAERTKELLTVLEVSHNVASVLELEPLLKVILDQLRIVIDCRRAILFKIEKDHLVVRAVAADDRPIILAPEPLDGDTSLPPLAIPLDRLGAVWDMLRSGETGIVADIQGDYPLARDYRAAVAEYGLSYKGERSWMMVPMVMHGRTVGVILVFHDQPNMYTADHAQLARAIADQAAVAMENARLYEQAQQTAVLEERQRLARELHDAVTQTLFSASLIAEVLPRLWERDPAAGMQRLEDVRALTRGALAEMRTLLLELRPAAIVQAELGDLLRQLAEILTGRSRLPVNVTVNGEGELPPDVQLAVYRVAQEALHNIEKHAKASQVDVGLSFSAGAVELRIEDDGCGFDPAAGADSRLAHFGMSIMRDRAKAVGATFTVRSEPGSGTEVLVRWSDGQGGRDD
jgi:PAS domain S-box-containing protein